MNIKDIIILGAGASASDGAPLQNKLFKEFFDYYSQNNVWNSEEQVIIDFFEEFWGIDINNYQNRNVLFPTFEECLGVLDLACSRGESLKGYNEKKINDVRNALIFLIGKILDEKLRREMIHHKDLVTRLKDEGKLKQTTFISLNYDIIIDNALIEVYPDYHLDYGIDFVNFERGNNWKKPKKNKSVLLLKLHGSLNWLYCPTCSHMELTPKEKGAVNAFYNAEKCRSCETPMKPVIIPPTFYKEMSNPSIQEIFLKADKVLRDAERIFICGYSFPNADIHIKYLLKRSEKFRGETSEIYVINDHRGKTEPQKDDEKQRFMRFFKEKEKVHYTDLSFEKFAEKGVENV